MRGDPGRGTRKFPVQIDNCKTYLHFKFHYDKSNDYELKKTDERRERKKERERIGRFDGYSEHQDNRVEKTMDYLVSSGY